MANCYNETSVELLMFVFFVAVFSSKYLPTAVFVEGINKLFDSFNSVKRAAPGKVLHSPLSDNSPHIGHWTKASMGIKSCIFLEDDKPACKKPTPSHNGWITDICAVQHCGSNSNATVEQYVDALKTSIINGLAYTGLRNANCEGVDPEA